MNAIQMQLDKTVKHNQKMEHIIFILKKKNSKMVKKGEVNKIKTCWQCNKDY